MTIILFLAQPAATHNESSLEHIPPMLQLHVSESSIDLHVCVLLTTFSYVCQVSCAHEQKAYGLQQPEQVRSIGVANRNSLFVTLVGCAKRNRSILKPVFCQFRQVHCAYELLRCLDLKMWRFSCRQQTTIDRRLLPLVHARGVIIFLLLAT